jgi:hypothetical protein
MFRTPRSGATTTAYSACVLGERLPYWRNDWLMFRAPSDPWCVVSLSAFFGRGFGPCSFHLVFRYVTVKIYLGKLYTVRKLSSSSFCRYNYIWDWTIFKGVIMFFMIGWFQPILVVNAPRCEESRPSPKLKTNRCPGPKLGASWDAKWY